MLKMESKFLKHEACPKCGSKNNLARYTDGHAHCFTPDCGYYEKAEGVATPMNNTMNNDLYVGQTTSLKDRGISQETASKYGVTTLTNNGMITKHVYPYFSSDKKHVANKIRTLPKEFTAQGNFGLSQLFGQQLFSGGQKYITICEGECDAMSTYEMMGSKWASVSIKNGVQSAVRDCKQNFEYLDSFENIIICFDNDNIGKATANKVAEIFSPNKCKIVNMELKDANEYLRAGQRQKFVQCWWNAKSHTPEGILRVSDIRDNLWKKKDRKTCPYPFDGLNEKLYGARTGELVTITSGTGMGKSSFMRELVYHFWKTTQDNIGLIFLEEDAERTLQGVLGIHTNKQLHLDEVWEKENIEDLNKVVDEFDSDRLTIYNNSFGSLSDEQIMSRIRFMAKGCDCKWIFVDHLSLIMSAREDNNERKAIDLLMTKLRGLCHETKVGMFLVSHLRRLDNDKGHEEGKQVSLSHLRGSHAIAQLSDAVIGMERNQQEEDEVSANTSVIRVLKNRYAGITGIASYLLWSKENGRMTEIENPFKEKNNDNETN
jgi:twinkle protein